MINSILKIFALSIALSYLIKYGGRFLPVSGTVVTALVGVLTLPILMAIALGWRWQKQVKNEKLKIKNEK